MQCAELEERIGQLLDEGRSPDGDPAIVAHVALCAHCGTLVDAYHSMLAGADALPMPELSRTFTSRIVNRAFSAQRGHTSTGDNRRRASRLQIGHSAWVATAGTLAVAASLFLVAGIWWRSAPTDNPDTGGLLTTAGADGTSFSVPGIPRGLQPERIHAVCLSTGQSLATLPAVFRAVDTARFSGHFRPVVGPMGAAWEAVMRTLPSGESATPEAGSDTGWIHGAGQCVVA